MKRNMIDANRMMRRTVVITAIVIFFAICIGPVMGMTVIPVNRDVNLLVANDAGARFNDYGTNTYNFFNAGQTASQGLNALHISTSPTDSTGAVSFGQVTTSSAQSGTFYLTDTGGRGWDDDGILMLAVKGTVADNFRVHIRSSGYRWSPVSTGTYPTFTNVTYYPVALDEYFDKADFIYGPQIWKPCPAVNYPVFDGQNMADTANTFSIMFIDLNAGILGTGTLNSPSFSGQTVNDKGALKVEYTFENLQTFAAFNDYAYTVSSNQGQGIRWTNRLSETGSSGYTVLGVPSTPSVVPLPGQVNPPTDPDHDGLYEDLSGNGQFGYGDVVLFFKNIETIPDTEPVSAFDFSGNGAIGFQDVVLLFKEVP